MRVYNKEKKELLIFSAIFIAVLGILVFLFPYSGDDWAWGSSLGMERLQNLFRDYNGRYLGNIVVMILTRSNILRTVIITGTLYGLVYLGAKYTSQDKKVVSGMYLGAVLLICTPKEVWMQSVVWTSGYANYVISMLLVFIYFLYTKRIFKSEKPEFKNKHTILFIILGFSTALFVEHVTLYCLVMSIFIIAYTKIKFKKIYLSNIGYFIGTTMGTILMFSNGAYRKIAEGTETYRSIPKEGGFIEKAFDSYYNVIYKQLAYNNVVLNIVIAIIIAILAIKYINSKQEKVVIASGILFITVGYSAYSLIGSLNPEWKILLKHTDMFNGIFSIVYYIGLIGASILFIKNRERKERTLFLLGSLTILVGPLFFVNPIGPRCFFGTYVIFILIALEFFKALSEEGENRGIKVLIVGLLVIQFTYWFSIYGYIYKINNERLEAVKIGLETKKQEIIIPKLPYKKYVWTGDPFSLWIERFKLFHNIPEEVEIKTVDLKKWDKINK